MEKGGRPFPNRLRTLRKSAGLEQSDIFKRLGYKCNSCLSNWERGKKMPSGNNLIKLCILFNVPVDELYPEHYEKLKDELLNQKK